MVDQRRARLDAGGHRRLIHLREDIAGHVLQLVAQHHALVKVVETLRWVFGTALEALVIREHDGLLLYGDEQSIRLVVGARGQDPRELGESPGRMRQPHP
jgi:hypothetical protein